MPTLCLFLKFKSKGWFFIWLSIQYQKAKPAFAAPSPKLWRVGDKASTGKEKKAGDRSGKVAASYLLGQMLAEKAKAKGISKIKFDRAGYKYHGRVKALAEGAREGGLIF